MHQGRRIPTNKVSHNNNEQKGIFSTYKPDYNPPPGRRPYWSEYRKPTQTTGWVQKKRKRIGCTYLVNHDYNGDSTSNCY